MYKGLLGYGEDDTTGIGGGGTASGRSASPSFEGLSRERRPVETDAKHPPELGLHITLAGYAFTWPYGMM